MEVTLRALGDPGFQEGVSYDMGIHQSTVSRAVHETICKICNKKDEWVKFPTTFQECQKVYPILLYIPLRCAYRHLCM